MNGRDERSGFTLIELLIVVAIIAILAAIAVPNFLEAQLRSKVSRVKADMRSLATALEAYGVDNNAYPLLRAYMGPGVPPSTTPGSPRPIDRGPIAAVIDLTTPIAYIASVVIPDPFVSGMPETQWWDIPVLVDPAGHVYKTLAYVNITENRRANGRAPCEVQWVVISLGPDKLRGPGINLGGYSGSATRTPGQSGYFAQYQYDPTNGTVSNGDIFMYQGRGF